MREIQEAMRVTNPSSRVLTVIRAVLTRWTSHYLAYTRLLELRWVLETLVRNDENAPPGQRRLTAGNSAARNKAHEMIVHIKDPFFWCALIR